MSVFGWVLISLLGLSLMLFAQGMLTKEHGPMTGGELGVLIGLVLFTLTALVLFGWPLLVVVGRYWIGD